MRNQTDFGKLIAVIGFVVPIGEGVAHGQIDGRCNIPHCRSAPILHPIPGQDGAAARLAE